MLFCFGRMSALVLLRANWGGLMKTGFLVVAAGRATSRVRRHTRRGGRHRRDADEAADPRRAGTGSMRASFVRLHTPSAYYGVNFAPARRGTASTASTRNTSYYQRATGVEDLRGHFADAAERLGATGRGASAPGACARGAGCPRRACPRSRNRRGRSRGRPTASSSTTRTTYRSTGPGRAHTDV